MSRSSRCDQRPATHSLQQHGAAQAGRERICQLMNVIEADRVDLKSLVTHRYKLDDIEAAYGLFGNQRDGVLKVAIST